jgi:hypothetical protein
MNVLEIDKSQSRQKASETWVVVASLFQARLLRFHSPLRKSCQLEERARIEAPLSATACERSVDGDNTGQSYLARYQQLQEGYQRFARQLARWVLDKSREHAVGHITVFAPARMLQWLKPLAAELDTIEVDLRADSLMNAYDDALRRHPEILALLQPQHPSPQPHAVTHLIEHRTRDQQLTDKRLRKVDRPWRVFSPIPTATYRQ